MLTLETSYGIVKEALAVSCRLQLEYAGTHLSFFVSMSLNAIMLLCLDFGVNI
jgi:hypothetical protein